LVNVLVETATRYYQVLTGSAWVPSLVGQQS
jgi:hypothetical protein